VLAGSGAGWLLGGTLHRSDRCGRTLDDHRVVTAFYCVSWRNQSNAGRFLVLTNDTDENGGGSASDQDGERAVSAVLPFLPAGVAGACYERRGDNRGPVCTERGSAAPALPVLNTRAADKTARVVAASAGGLLGIVFGAAMLIVAIVPASAKVSERRRAHH